MKIRTRSFSVTRLQLAYLAAEEYVRTFWWYVAIVPVFGLLAVIFGRGPVQTLGFLGLLWPISIPARAIFSTTKASRLLRDGVFVSTNDDYLLVHGRGGEGLKLEFVAVRGAVERQGHLLIRTRRFGFIPIALSAFDSAEQANEFAAWIVAEADRRLDLE